MPPCKFFNSPKGCKFGDRCKLEHIVAGTSTPVDSSNRAGDNSAPRGVCINYWKDGVCRWGFDCRYRHTTPNDTTLLTAAPKTTSTRDTDRTLALELVAPYLKAKGLEKISPGSGVDSFVSPSDKRKLNPQQFHNEMKNYLRDEFGFTSSVQMCIFASLFSHASTENPTWTDDDGQTLLITISKKNGLLRLNDILCHSNVSMSAGTDPGILSFQRGYLPILKYLASNFVVKSTMNQHVNALYNLIDQNMDHHLRVIGSCIEESMTVKSFKDTRRPLGPTLTGLEVFMTLVNVLFEYLQRYKNATTTHTGIADHVSHLERWVGIWVNGISSSPPSFEDPLSEEKERRQFLVRNLRDRLQRSIDIVKREKGAHEYYTSSRSQAKSLALKRVIKESEHIGILAALENDYEGPGTERPTGPRHDNDFVDIDYIRIAPTDDELRCRIPPFLPANIPNAPHPFASDSMKRLLDIQFRLLREELIASLRRACNLIQDDLASSQRSGTKLSAILKKQGGRYQYQDRHESIMFNVYTGVGFSRFNCDRRRGLVAELCLDTPPGSARSDSAQKRAAYWKNGKRFMTGGLVALVWPQANNLEIYLGNVASSLRDLEEQAKKGRDDISVRVTFYDMSANSKFLEILRKRLQTRDLLLIECPILFESIRPFLESLKREPETFPLRKYLVHHDLGTLAKMTIDPPEYSLAPGFSYNLSCLLRGEDELSDLLLTTVNKDSVEAARNILKTNSSLDPSQADAIVDVLTKEVALLQGPPGTGKTYVGVELIRVLVENEARPIVLIAFTNHALDHLLRSVLEAGITKKIVRLGSRCSDEKIAPFSLEEQEKLADPSRLESLSRGEISSLRDVEKELKEILNEYVETEIPSERLEEHMDVRYPYHIDAIRTPPTWIGTIYALQKSEFDAGWRTNPKKNIADIEMQSMYTFWLRGGDINFLQASRSSFRKAQTPTHAPNSNHFSVLSSIRDHPIESSMENDEDDGDSDELSSPDFEDDWQNRSTSDESYESDDTVSPVLSVKSISSEEPTDTNHFESTSLALSDINDPIGFFASFEQPSIPQVPMTDREVKELLLCYDVWDTSVVERGRLHAFWVNEAKETICEDQKDRFNFLKERHDTLREQLSERDTEIRKRIIRNCDLIACTTTGAAKLTSMLKGLTPKVMLVEEAGQVLESHVLGSLVQSIEHLILIGDPLQLRPTINNFSLSMDNPRGKKLYLFDRSLMERLSDSGLAMSKLNVQRRMRPSIAELMRLTLYPDLCDNDIVRKYPPVRGMAKDVFFLSHSHPERGGGEDDVSKHNVYEVSMIKDLVKYLLRQGTYSKEGDIVVLCAYLGQLLRVRDALSQEFTVVLDERDKNALDDLNNADGNEEPHLERVGVMQRVKIRSIDNYQGEEADIVILSLVRNSGSDDKSKSTEPGFARTRRNIGFLKSENRTNVALSRARHGLYILGNSSDLLLHSDMWGKIIGHLESTESIGDKLPIECHRHPEEIRYVSQPGDLPSLSPDGGCLRACGERLKCGHLCPYKCHCDDENHYTTICNQSCQRLCSRGHPCQKKCVDECGRCETRIRNVRLACGHFKDSVPCWQLDDLDQVYCSELVTRTLLSCEHSTEKECGLSIENIKCMAVCNGIMDCCGKNCKSRCFECQEISRTTEEEITNPRTSHRKHSCSKPLHCQHTCTGICEPNHKCVVQCKSTCRQKCMHSECKRPCSEACEPCKEPCPWVCPHGACPVPCGSICTRLPCDKPCESILKCGHKCPSVCGEDCSIQICLEPSCTPKEVLERICDLILQRSLSDLMPEQGTLDERIITNPDCRHVFTVETLDGHCSMSDYYEQGTDGEWKALKLPAPGYKKPPTCPTCRTAIRTPRYGRIYKRADLDILEMNVAASLMLALQRAEKLVTDFDKDSAIASTKEKLSTLAFPKQINDPKEDKRRASKRNKLLNSDEQLPIRTDSINPASNQLFGLPDSIAPEWARMVAPLTNAYRQAVKVAKSRSAHVAAYESSFATIYRNELDSYLENINRAPRDPELHAMRMARIRIGSSRPVADKKYCVEAIWLTISIRFILAELASKWLDPTHLPRNYDSSYSRIWALYIDFLLKSCERDAKIALNIAGSSDNHRQISRSSLLVLTSWLEASKFSYKMFQKREMNQDDRKKLSERVGGKRVKAAEIINAEKGKYCRLGLSTGDNDSFNISFTIPAESILDELKNLEQTILTGVFYQPIMDDDLKQVILALRNAESSYSYSGHFYTCPNGHPYTIGDCGGANGTSRCPECFAEIGGHNHTLISTNRHDTRMENLARELGSAQSPFSWGRVD